jgi:hypothetical protein
MHPKTRRLSSLLALTVIGTIAAAEAAAVNRDPSAMRVEGIHADGGGVYVTLSNPAPVSRSGVLLVRTFVAGREIDLPISFRIEGETTASFEAKLPCGGTVVDVTIVLDDGSPF